MKTDNKKSIAFSKPLGKPTLEMIWTGIPKLSFSPDSTDEMPTLVDKENCGKSYHVEDGRIYTIRLGMHSHPDGIGAFAKDSIAVCEIPTTISKRHQIIALFATQEIYPALFMDYVSLNSHAPFRLELVKGSAMLERNNGTKGLNLGDNAISLEEDMVIISQSNFSDKTPDYLTYTYDFITFQVEVVLERECILRKHVRLVDGKGAKWCDSVETRVGDSVEFRIQYLNGSGSVQKVSILEVLPPCLEYVKSEAFLYGPGTPEGKPISSNAIVADGSMEIESCEPEGSVIICYTAKVIDHPPEDQQNRTWVWTEVQAGSKILQGYAELVIE